MLRNFHCSYRSRLFVCILLFLVLVSVTPVVQLHATSPIILSGIPAVETDHPYRDNEGKFWTIPNNASGLNASRIHFARLEFEDGVDKILISDENDVLIQEIAMSAPDGLWSEIVPGALVKVTLKTDGSGRFWGFLIDEQEALNYTTIAHSPHYYPNDSEEAITLLNNMANPAGTRVHFDRVELEPEVDYLVISDINGTPYQWITGTQPNGLTSKAVPGPAIKIQLVSDRTVGAWGYNIDAVETAAPDAPDSPPNFANALAESSHNYTPNTDQVWTIVNPNPDAASSKVHFSRLALSDNDGLQILDANDNIIQTFGENIDLSDLWSDSIPGRVIKVRFHSSQYDEQWGFRIDAVANSISNPGLAQSNHPYAPNTDQVWTIVNPNPNAASSKVHFSWLFLSDNDGLQILDANDNVIQTFGENIDVSDLWSDSVPGRVVKVHFYSSQYDEQWGFRIDGITKSVPNPGLAQSNHPYVPNTDQVWTIVNPNPNAASSKVHFSRLALSDNDQVQILDANDNVVQTIDENTQLFDFWSDSVPGRVVKVHFHSSQYDEQWGFRIDGISPISAEPVPPASVTGLYVTMAFPGTIHRNGVQVAYAQEPGEYKILLPGVGDYTIHIEYDNATQDITAKVDAQGNIRVTYSP